MPPISNCLAFSLLWLLLSAVQCVKIDVVHSFDGIHFLPLGVLSGTLFANSDLTLTRSALSKSDIASLKDSLSKDGFYSIGLLFSESDNPFLVSSVRASCFSTSNLLEKAKIYVNEDGIPSGFSYTLCSSSCNTPSDSLVTEDLQLPHHLEVKVMGPEPGSLVFGQNQEGTKDLRAPSADIRTFVDQESQAPAMTQEGASSQEGSTPKVDERTWLQKNWMLALSLTLIVANLLGKAFGPPQQQGGAPRAQGARR